MIYIVAVPANYAAYAGSNIPASTFQNVFISCDACQELCDASATCRGFDYNVNNGGCWFQNSEAIKCDAPGSAPSVYHATKLPPLCSKYHSP